MLSRSNVTNLIRFVLKFVTFTDEEHTSLKNQGPDLQKKILGQT